MDQEHIQLIKLAATVAGATAAVIGLISKPLWSRLNRMEAGIDTKIDNAHKTTDDKLANLTKTVDGIKARVGENNTRIGQIEVWTGMHEVHDDERHEESLDTRKELKHTVDGLRQELQQGLSDLREDLKP